jgi:hypothetical protein
MAVTALIGTRRRRAFPDAVAAEINALPERRRHQHVVDLEMNDGRVIRKVWAGYGRFPALIGGRTLLHRYRPRDVVHARPHDAKRDGVDDFADKLDFAHPALRDCEAVIAAFPANSGRFGTYGGRLLVTNARVIFQPHRVSRLLGGRVWDAGRDTIVATTPISSFPRGVRLTFSDGSSRTLVISQRVAQVLEDRGTPA